MTVAELKERYIYAATRRLPSKTKKDIAKELETLVDDMLVERCGEKEPSEKDMRVIIAELGQPSEIHSKYSPKADKSLISPPYYEQYLFILKIVIPCIVFGLTLAHIIMYATGDKYLLDTVFSWIFGVGSALCGSFTFITLLFAFFSHKGIDLKDFDDEINSLQPVPKTNTRISKAESICNIVFCLAFAMVLISFPNIIFCVINGEFVQILNTEVLRSAWVWIILFTAVSIFRESIALMDAKYTKRLLYVTLCTNLITLICNILIFVRENIINPELIKLVFTMDKLPNTIVTSALQNTNLILLGIVIFALIIDTAHTLWKYYKTEK